MLLIEGTLIVNFLLLLFILVYSQNTCINPAIEMAKLKDLEIISLSSMLKKYNKTKIKVRFKIIGVTAIDANFPRVFRYAPIKDVRQINNTNGKASLERSIAIENLSLLKINPGAINVIINGIEISAKNTKPMRKTKSMEKILEKNLSDDTNPDSDLIPETTGINAAFIAPSPKILLKRFGSLKATKKQSEIIPAPIILAINKSLM